MMQKLAEYVYALDAALSADFCQRVIDKFESDPRKQKGMIGEGVFRPDIKRSLDLQVSGVVDWEQEDEVFVTSLRSSLAFLSKTFPHTSFDGSDEGYQIQKTLPGDFYVRHVDWAPTQATRSFVVIWYLNDVDSGGETFFEYQNLKVKPEVGKMLIFPPYWMFPHQGLTPVSGTKYICTSWMHLL